MSRHWANIRDGQEPVEIAPPIIDEAEIDESDLLPINSEGEDDEEDEEEEANDEESIADSEGESKKLD